MQVTPAAVSPRPRAALLRHLAEVDSHHAPCHRSRTAVPHLGTAPELRRVAHPPVSLSQWRQRRVRYLATRSGSPLARWADWVALLLALLKRARHDVETKKRR